MAEFRLEDMIFNVDDSLDKGCTGFIQAQMHIIAAYRRSKTEKRLKVLEILDKSADLAIKEFNE